MLFHCFLSLSLSLSLSLISRLLFWQEVVRPQSQPWGRRRGARSMVPIFRWLGGIVPYEIPQGDFGMLPDFFFFSPKNKNREKLYLLHIKQVQTESEIRTVNHSTPHDLWRIRKIKVRLRYSVTLCHRSMCTES